MLILLIIIFIAIGIAGVVCRDKVRNYTIEGVCNVISIVGFVLALVTFLCGAIGIGGNIETLYCEEKINLYQTENTKIEQQINEIVENYKDYEKSTLKELKGKDVTTIVTLYPELKTDNLVRKQIEIYQKNKQKIVKLKEERIVASVVRWWLYFGN